MADPPDDVSDLPVTKKRLRNFVMESSSSGVDVRMVDREQVLVGGTGNAIGGDMDGKCSVEAPVGVGEYPQRFARNHVSFRDKLLGGSEVVINSMFDGDDSDEELGQMEDMPECLEKEDDLWPRIMISKEEKKRLCEPWKGSLIVKLLGKTLGFNYLCSRLKQKWSPMGEFSLIDLGNDFYIAKFDNPEDVQFVLDGGPWIIADHYLSIQRWKSGFRPSNAKISSTAVWIRLPELSVEYFDRDTLEKIGNSLGRILKIDRNTAQSARGRFARICVEIDLNKPLFPKVWVGSSWQKVEYEGLHMVCFECGCYGHRMESCKAKEEAIRAEVEVAMKGIDNIEIYRSEGEDDEPASNEKYGPWMLVNQKARKNQFSTDPKKLRGKALENKSSNVGLEGRSEAEKGLKTSGAGSGKRREGPLVEAHINNSFRVEPGKFQLGKGSKLAEKMKEMVGHSSRICSESQAVKANALKPTRRKEISAGQVVGGLKTPSMVKSAGSSQSVGASSSHSTISSAGTSFLCSPNPFQLLAGEPELEGDDMVEKGTGNKGMVTLDDADMQNVDPNLVGGSLSLSI